MMKIVLMIFLFCISFALEGCDIQHSDSNVRALLDETGVSYELKKSYSSIWYDLTYCDVIISQDQIDAFAAKLGLNNELKNHKGKTRFIVVPDYLSPSRVSLGQYREDLAHTQWNYKHGYTSALLFYNKKTGEGRLFLDTSFG